MYQVDADDFGIVSGLMTYNGESNSDSLSDEDIALWNEFMPYSPMQVHGLLTEGYDGIEPHLYLDIPDTGLLDFKLVLPENKDFRVAGAFGLGRMEGMGLSEVRIPEDMQRRGMGRNWLRTQIEFSAALDYDHYAFSAGLDSGGFVWAKAGAQLDRSPDRHADIHTQLGFLSHTLFLKLEALRPYLSKEDYGLSRVFCRATGSHDMNRLAEMNDATIPVTALPEILDRVDHLLETSFSTPDLDVGISTRSALSHAFEQAEKRDNGKVALSEALLISSFWPAVVDFRNEEAMETISRYVGGWRTMEQSYEPAMA